MTKTRQVILGGGAAGLSAIKAIRQVDPDCPITLVTGESGLPYARMAIPYFVMGKIPFEGIFPHDPDYFASLNVQMILGRPALKVNFKNHLVKLEDGSSVKYDNLLIATGSRPERRDVPGLNLPGVLNMWTSNDAEKIKKIAQNAQTIVVWGAGMVAFLSVKALIKPGRKIYLVCRGERIFRRVLDDVGSTMIEKELTKLGVTCSKGINITEISPFGKRQTVTFTDGKTIETDLVITALGVTQNLDFLGDKDPLSRKGIEINRNMESIVPGVYAAGDVAVLEDCITGENTMPALWTSAVLGGRAAGWNMAGRTYECEHALAMNIMDLFGYSVVSVGQGLATDGVELHQFLDKTKGNYRRFVFKGERMIGAILVGDVTDAGVLPVLIRNRFDITHLKEYIINYPWDIADIVLAHPVFREITDRRYGYADENLS